MLSDHNSVKIRKSLIGISVLLFEMATTSVSPSNQAYAYSIGDYYSICLRQADSRGCAVLGRLCGSGNGDACSALQSITIRGYNRIHFYCSRRSRQACDFISAVDRIGVTNLAQLCGRGNSTACQSLNLIRCYATEVATGNYYRGGFRY